MYDLAQVVERLHTQMEFRFTGVVTPECRELRSRMSAQARFDGHVPEAQLRESYEWADILILPSIQDGFGVVLSHAQAGAIPFIASENTGGRELLELGGKGWIVPIRAPEQIEQQLKWCNEHRDALASDVEQLVTNPVLRTWGDFADDLMAIVLKRRA
jgi:alpha-maltose-1-phosphate synthase